MRVLEHDRYSRAGNHFHGRQHLVDLPAVRRRVADHVHVLAHAVRLGYGVHLDTGLADTLDGLLEIASLGHARIVVVSNPGNVSRARATRSVFSCRHLAITASASAPLTTAPQLMTARPEEAAVDVPLMLFTSFRRTSFDGMILRVAAQD